MSRLADEPEEWLYPALDGLGLTPPEWGQRTIRPGDYVKKVGDIFSANVIDRVRLGIVIAIRPASSGRRYEVGGNDVLVLWSGDAMR